MGLPTSLEQDLKIPRYANLRCDSLGHDSFEHCFDRNLFRSFGPVSYQFNEIGYRTKSIAEFTGQEILAIGDSFTLGLGVNAVDRWSDQLELLTGLPVLNLSLNGASNDWIARRLQSFLTWFTPVFVIVHWSFSHRREAAQPTWYDDERTQCEPGYSAQENFDNWLQNFQCVHGCKVLHTAIPGWHDGFDHDLWPVVKPMAPVDLARDGFHYGPLTHRLLAEKFTNLLGAL
jgi:hypothetical protein